MGRLSRLRAKRPVGGSSEPPSAARTLVHTGLFTALSQDSQAHRPSCLTHTLVAVSPFSHVSGSGNKNNPLVKNRTMTQVRAPCWRWCLFGGGNRCRLRAKKRDKLPSTPRAVNVSSSLRRKFPPFFLNRTSLSITL